MNTCWLYIAYILRYACANCFLVKLLKHAFNLGLGLSLICETGAIYHFDGLDSKLSGKTVTVITVINVYPMCFLNTFLIAFCAFILHDASVHVKDNMFVFVIFHNNTGFVSYAVCKRMEFDQS